MRLPWAAYGVIDGVIAGLLVGLPWGVVATLWPGGDAGHDPFWIVIGGACGLGLGLVIGALLGTVIDVLVLLSVRLRRAAGVSLAIAAGALLWLAWGDAMGLALVGCGWLLAVADIVRRAQQQAQRDRWDGPV